ncbi:hypothetical protein [Ferruginibacter sp. SUN106]|uniref:hypothetical protein n=1 Tax=Ferruginibacter sp. SUN106 TaxID=2978348 RepID=UPI003D362D0F
MWILIVIAIAVVFFFSKYSSDKSQLRKNVILQGGLDQVFINFLECVKRDFAEYKIVKMSENELEIFTLTKDGQNFVFVNKLGFGDKVNYRCDPKRSNYLNAEIVVEGNVSNQVQSYQMILSELIKKHAIETE